jgi:hypothetical protein
MTDDGVRRIPVAFAGKGEGEDELSWGQREIWQAMRDLDMWMPIGGTQPVPPGFTVQDAVEQLRYLMSRYQSMRTLLRFTDDGIRQVVHGAGEIDLEVVEAGAADPLEVALAVQHRFAGPDYDFATDWPVRMAVVCRDGTPTHLVVIMSHFVMDGTGASIMLAEGGRKETAPVDGMQALEQVQWQRSPAGQRQNAGALRHWESTLRTIPAQRYAGKGDPQTPRYWRGELSSAALALGIASIAARTRVDAGAVALALYAASMARIGGVDPVATRLITSNRFRPGLSQVVAPVSQTALCMIDVGDAPFDEIVERARRAAMNAYKHSYYDRFALSEIIAATAPDTDLDCFFNDRRGPVQPSPATPEALHAALPRTVFNWTMQRDEMYPRLFLNVDDEGPDMVRLHIEIDTHHMPPSAAEALLRAMESLAVREAEGHER